MIVLDTFTVKTKVISKRRHQTDLPEYKVWQSMKQRCNNPNCPHFHNYGGRGIKVCERWLNDFWAFYDDIGPIPTYGFSLDRIDNNGNYEPSNCHWATKKQQSRNTRRTVYLEVDGAKVSRADWLERLERDREEERRNRPPYDWRVAARERERDRPNRIQYNTRAGKKRHPTFWD